MTDQVDRLLTADNITVLSMWARAVIVEEVDPTDPELRSPALNVQCGDEVKRASIGDHIIQHRDGTFDVLGPLAYQKQLRRSG